jgi:hypothetical protein
VVGYTVEPLVARSIITIEHKKAAGGIPAALMKVETWTIF